MKNILKSLYVFINNPLILLHFKRIGKHFFIGKQSNLRNLKYLRIGDNVRIGDFARINFYDVFFGEKYNPSLEIGSNVYIGNHFTLLCTDNMRIEDQCLIASYVTITTENHGINPLGEVSYGKQPLVSKPIIIKKGAWIGEKVTILPGAIIGEKAIIGANSVVTKEIPAYSIAVGSPAKVVKMYNFDKEKWEKVGGNYE